MTTTTGRTAGTAGVSGEAPWTPALQAAAALAASMGIGRFAYTPILPLMHAQAPLSAQYGSGAGHRQLRGLPRGRAAGHGQARGHPVSADPAGAGLALVVVTLALMAATENHAAWLALRLAAGIASALVFMIAVSALLTGLRGPRQYRSGWEFSGVGAGIALSGAVVLAAGTWRTAWLAAAGFALILTVGAWPLRPGSAPCSLEPCSLEPCSLEPRSLEPRSLEPRTRPSRERRRRYSRGPRPAAGSPALLTSYSLEGVGYIIAGTFLVAAINENSPAWAGSGAWVLTGLAAVPASAAWALLSPRWTRSSLLCAALLIQAAGIALPALVSGVVPALLSAVLFGATFLGVASMALALGLHLRYPRAVALLTTGYGLGQILGPLVVTPLLHHGYHLALLIAAGIVLAAALAAAVLRMELDSDWVAASRNLDSGLLSSLIGSMIPFRGGLVVVASRRAHHQVTFTVLALGIGAFALLQSLVVPVLTTVQHQLHTSQDTVTWVLTAYLLSASIMTPILGRVGDMTGKKRVFVAALVALAVGSLLAALAPSIGVMIVARVIQGAGGGWCRSRSGSSGMSSRPGRWPARSGSWPR